MFSPDLESRILKEAQAKGLIPDVPAFLDLPTVLGKPSPAEAVDIWGSRLYSLVNAGGMSPEALNALAWDAIGGEAGSWVDPLFEGQAPLGDIPGLGSRYTDLVLMGEGATARVYKALDTLLQRQVALKILRDPSGTTLAEARAQAQVEHPNVCRIYEVGQGHLVMQLVEGPTLARLAPTLDRNQKLRAIRDVALGVHAAHERGLVHLDLKLNNILMQRAEDGAYHPVVSDFGMVASQGAEATGSCSMGTPPYTSPEQLAGDPTKLDRRADVYAMGVMLYVLLAGVIPFPAHDFQRLLEAMAHDEPVPLRQRDPKLPKDLAALVHRCLAKAPEARYPSARALAEDLDHFLDQVPVAAAGHAWHYRLGKWALRNRKLTWVAGLALAALVITGGVMLRNTAFVADQAEWDHHFQKAVEELRSQLDHAYRQPAHDISPELQQARGALKLLEEEVDHTGRAGQGPGHLALGQARLLLNPQDPQALVQFQRAWDAGFRTQAARTWLALSLLDSYQNAQSSIWRQPDKPSTAHQREEVRQRFLIPARQMVQGRESAEQARVLHLLDQTEAIAQATYDPDRILQLARDYRARFPDDVEGMLEEAEALQGKADRLWSDQSKGAVTWPPPGAADVEPLRQAASRLLREAQRIAPSHPRVYAALANLGMNQDNLPTEGTPSRDLLVRQTRDWLDQGLRVSRDDPVLVSPLTWFLATSATVDRLQRGLDPQPPLRELLEAWRRAQASGSGQNEASAQVGILTHAGTCGRFGIPSVGPLLEVFDHIERHAQVELDSKEVREFYPFWSLGAAPHLVEAGQDPTPYLMTALRFVDPTSPFYDWEAPYRLDLARAEFAHLTGGEAAAALAEADTRFQHRPWKKPADAWLELSLRLLQAQVSNTAGAWTGLEAALGRAEGLPRPEYPDSNHALALAKARLGLARHLLDVGREAGALLQATRQGLQEASQGDARLPADVVHERLAELCLVEARLPGRAATALQEGLRETDLALVYIRPLTPAELRKGGRTRGPGMYWPGPPHQGRTWQVKGELLLAMARQENAPRIRQQWAHEALAAFQAALQWNKNLEHGLATDRSNAEALNGPGHHWAGGR